MTVFTGDAIDTLNALTVLTVLYMFAAVGYIIWYKKSEKYKATTG